jgi:hypothetical protein
VGPVAQVVDVHLEDAAVAGLADQRDAEHVEERREDRDDVDAHAFESRHPSCFLRVTGHQPHLARRGDAEVIEK